MDKKGQHPKPPQKEIPKDICDKCKSVYSPRVLDCAHTVCLGCIHQKYIEESKVPYKTIINCPQPKCKEKTILPCPKEHIDKYLSKSINIFEKIFCPKCLKAIKAEPNQPPAPLVSCIECNESDMCEDCWGKHEEEKSKK